LLILLAQYPESLDGSPKSNAVLVALRFTPESLVFDILRALQASRNSPWAYFVRDKKPEEAEI
jgi:hypothetical protein